MVEANVPAVFAEPASHSWPAPSASWLGARRLLGATHGERATRLYSFCRRVDDLADHAADATVAHAALTAIRHALQTGGSDAVEVVDMLELMRTCGIEPSVPLEFVRGVESDLSDVRVRDIDELLHYGYRVAGTVGLMMAAALDVSERNALRHAIDLGIAMQLTNICRDVREDALMGRRYLPASLVGAIDPQQLVDPTPSVRVVVAGALQRLLKEADQLYASGERGLHYLNASARASILVAARGYRGIGTALRKRGFDCWSSRAASSGANHVALLRGALGATSSALATGVARAPVAPDRCAGSWRFSPPRGTESGSAD